MTLKEIEKRLDLAGAKYKLVTYGGDGVYFENIAVPAILVPFGTYEKNPDALAPWIQKQLARVKGIRCKLVSGPDHYTICISDRAAWDRMADVSRKDGDMVEHFWELRHVYGVEVATAWADDFMLCRQKKEVKAA